MHGTENIKIDGSLSFSQVTFKMTMNDYTRKFFFPLVLEWLVISWPSALLPGAVDYDRALFLATYRTVGFVALIFVTCFRLCR